MELGRPRLLTEEPLVAIRQDLAEELPIAVVARKCGGGQVHAPREPDSEGVK